MQPGKGNDYRFFEKHPGKYHPGGEDPENHRKKIFL
jgi:hypothetical protein